MRFSAPWSNSLDIIALNPEIYILGIKPKGLTAPWHESLDIIALHQVKKSLEINPMSISFP